MRTTSRAITLEQLVAETAWLRQLASTLVNDRAAAEDLVHDTVLVAAEQGPRDGRPLGPWLARVLRNRARMSGRSAARRSRRERAVAELAVAPASPWTIVDQSEYHCLLIKLILELKQPLRDVVLLYYYEDLPSAAIGNRLGIADGTVYLYFKSKDEILHSIFDRAMAEFIAEGKKELASICEPRAKLTRIAELHLEKLGADRNLAIVFQVELRGSTKFMQEFSATGFHEYLEIIRETIELGQKAGVFRADIKPIVAAKILYGSLDEMVTNWVLSKKSYPLAPMAGEVLKVFVGGVLAK